MCAADGRLTELNVSIGRSLRATEGDSGAVGPSRPDEPNLLANVAPGSDLETPGEELKRTIGRSPIPDGRAFDGVSTGIWRLIGGLVAMSF
jgi:hypothetical protein